MEAIYRTILMKWIVDLKNGIDHLACESQKNHIWAQAWDSNTKVKCYLTNDNFDPSCGRGQGSMFKSTHKINGKTTHVFPQHGVNEALSKVYLHYWLFDNYDESFKTHFNVTKGLFCMPKKWGLLML